MNKFISKALQFIGLMKSKKQALSKEPRYVYPTHQCGSQVLICGPTYKDTEYFGSFIVDASHLSEWAFDHKNRVKSSNEDEQRAREFLPLWLSIGNADRENYVSLIDDSMRHIVVPYLYDFYSKGWVTIFCHQCHAYHYELIDNAHDHCKVADTERWVAEWLCPNGHLLHHEKQELRWIMRR